MIKSRWVLSHAQARFQMSVFLSLQSNQGVVWGWVHVQISFYVSSHFVFQHSISLDWNNFSTFSCLDIWPAVLTTTITQNECCWECIGKGEGGWEARGMAYSLTEVRKWMILLLPGKIQQTNWWKKIIVYTCIQDLLFRSPSALFYDKGVKPWISW